VILHKDLELERLNVD